VTQFKARAAQRLADAVQAFRNLDMLGTKAGLKLRGTKEYAELCRAWEEFDDSLITLRCSVCDFTWSLPKELQDDPHQNLAPDHPHKDISLRARVEGAPLPSECLGSRGPGVCGECHREVGQPRCRARWRAGLLVPPNAIPDGARCRLPMGHDEDHKFR